MKPRNAKIGSSAFAILMLIFIIAYLAIENSGSFEGMFVNIAIAGAIVLCAFISLAFFIKSMPIPEKLPKHLKQEREEKHVVLDYTERE
ncbi:MAG: hypothetical protein JW772_02360 [Candidatus Diapherotrites archaeon]|nr:hypothetical protein [Candidatus Diapherotrites archaeon]